MKPQDAQALAEALLERHGLHAWRFAFDRAKRRFGCCHYHSRRITLSRHLTELNDEAAVRDTLLHEIAHALTPGHGHDKVWKATCRTLGARAERCYRHQDVREPPSRYLLVCDRCGLRLPRHRRSSRPLACRTCCDRHNGGRFSRHFTLRWLLNPATQEP